MSAFLWARDEALRLRRELVGHLADGPVTSKVLLGNVEGILNIGLQPVAKTNNILKGGNATLRRNDGFIYFRNDCNWDEQSYLIAHELGHFRLDPNCESMTIHINSMGLSPASYATAIVEAYGARERDELQKNVFGREFLLPRAVARQLFTDGHGPRSISKMLGIPLQVARQQVLDGVFLPTHTPDISGHFPAPSSDQLAAIGATEKHVHVVAGPGTGKTTTLIHRVRKLIEEDGVEPRKILVLTFSNKAAAELVEKLQRIGLKGASEIWAGTFHAFGLEFLRKYYQHFDIPSEVAVADKITQITLTAQALSGTKLEYYRRTDDPYEWLPPIIDVARRLKEELVDAEHYLAEALKIADSSEQAARFRDVVTVARAYTNALEESKLVDFVDLVAKPAKSIKDDRAKFAEVADRFQHVLVDEFQDLTTAMIELVVQLSKNAQSLWVVGDVRQAIYHWRGASLSALLDFGSYFPDARRYELVMNRRSTQEIIDVTVQVGLNHCLQKNHPLTTPQCKRGGNEQLPKMFQAHNQSSMWKALADDIKVKISEGVPLKEQVVLARKGTTVESVAEALQEHGIPTLFIGELLERPEIKNILAVIQLIVEKAPRALLRVAQLASPPMRLSDVRIILGAVAQDSALQRLGWLRSSNPLLSEDGETSRVDLSRKLNNFSWSTNPWDFICELLLERRFLLVDLEDQSIDAHLQRIALWQFAYMARTGDGDRKRFTLYRFLNRLRLRQQIRESYIDRELPPEIAELDGIRVMTIHASKGLEFEAVHLAAVHGAHFSGANSQNELLPPVCINSSDKRHEYESEVECNNLLYVAVSRAKDHLTVYENTKDYPPQFIPSVAVHAAIGNGKMSLLQAPVATLSNASKAQDNLTSTVGSTFTYEEFSTYDHCPRQYQYRFELELGRELSSNPSLQARSTVKRTLEGLAKKGNFSNYEAELARVWATSRLPEFSADPQLWEQALETCKTGAMYLSGVGGQYVVAKAEIKLISIEMPWGVAVAAPGGDVLHIVDFLPVSQVGMDMLERKLGQMLTFTTANRLGEVRLFDLTRHSTHAVTPAYVSDRSILSTRSAGLKSQNFEPRKSDYTCRRCAYLYVCPSLLSD